MSALEMKKSCGMGVVVIRVTFRGKKTLSISLNLILYGETCSFG